ncbi:MAG: transglycosylase domain-containing protein [Verrucomicrobia bacterium]|nr:transglycosylase domain-containing protein [Verrucomicrobiota bacterium]
MTEPRQRKPFYKRVWFIAVSFLLLAGLGGAAYFYFAFVVRYEAKAAEFDLSKLENLESASVIYDRSGNVYSKLFIQNREQVPMDQISPHLVDAVISAEDNRFYEHSGIDFLGIFRAALKNTTSGRIRQGASTVTQQLARNTFDLRDRTYDRKILEVFLSLRIERSVPKSKIMELYLNRVYFGGGLYGAQAASKGYFGKAAKDLTIGEAAMLAGLLKSPNNLSPWRNPEAAMAERDFVLGRMVDNNKITAAGAKAEQAQALQIRPKSTFVSQSYAIDFIRQQVQDELGFEALQSEGYKVYTTIDPDLQRAAEESLTKRLAEIEQRPDYQHQTHDQYTALLKQWRVSHPTANTPPAPEYLQGAVLAVDSRTGEIRVMVGGRDYGQSQFNRTYQASRPAGTAFVPFVFAAAFGKGIFPGSLADDSPMDNRQVMIGGTTGILGEWGVERVDNRYEGPIPLRRVLAESKNAATVRVGVEAGVDAVRDLAKKAGISDDLRPYPATFLGSSEVTLEDFVTAYTIFPGQGARPPALSIVSRIVAADGRVVYRHQANRENVLDPGIAFEVHSFLTDALNNGTGAKSRELYGLKTPYAAGKTGTAYNFTDNWFLGYDSAITCGVWVGFDKPQSIYRGAFANDTALPVWVSVMNASLTKDSPRELARPIDLKRAEVCLSTGLPASPHCLLTASNDPSIPARKGTFVEFTTARQMPKEQCWLHGDGNRSLARSVKNQDIPRAVSAADSSQVAAVSLREPTIIGNDPYNSVKPRVRDPGQTQTAKADWTPAPRALPVSTPEPEVRRAQPVGPLDRPQEQPRMDLPTPEPIDLSDDPTSL